MLAMLALRIGVALVLLLSGGAKLITRTETEHAAVAMGLPMRFSWIVVTMLTVIEVTAGVFLLVTRYATIGALLAFILVAALSATVVFNLLKGRRPACACFGPLSSSRPIGAHTLVRNAAILVALTVLLLSVGRGGGCALGCYPSDATKVLSGLAFGLLTVGVLVCLVVVAALSRLVGVLSARVRALERATSVEVSAGLNTGIARVKFDSLALEAALARSRSISDGQTIALTRLQQGQNLLVFLSASCQACTELKKHIETIIADLNDPICFLYGTSQLPAEQGYVAAGNLTLYRDSGVSEVLGVSYFPAAIVLDRFLAPISALHSGAHEVRHLLQEQEKVDSYG